MMKTAFLLLWLVWASAWAWGDDNTQTPQRAADLTQMRIEDLMNLEVTTASKKAQLLSEVPAAVYVVTQEDIRRSGATSIPDLLRMVPGIQVSQIDANKWAVSARGFNGRFASRLLVLMDGRSVYTPLFSGVFWDVQDTLLEDIERIEVIRGPGGSLWGANAVNGIINIITKSAKDTQGSLLIPDTGNQERRFGNFRYGGQWGEQGFYRIYGKYLKRDSLVDLTGASGTDGWNVWRGGFRFDRGTSGVNRFTLQGDVYSGDVGQRLNVPTLTPPFSQAFDDDSSVSGWNLLARWEREISERSKASVQMYLDRTERDALDVEEVRDTFDLDFQHERVLNRRHNRIWGLGYRRTSDRTGDSLVTAFDPKSRTTHLFSAFVQDDITFKEDVRLTLGSKLEHNDFSGFEVQPSVRLLWTPDERRTVWASVSRAVRTPSRSDHDVRAHVTAFPAEDGTPVLVAFFGDDGFKSETVVAHELGFRFQPTERFFIDTAAFYNVYKRIRTFEPDEPFVEMNPPPAHIVFPLRFDNRMHGKTHGFEVAGRWTVTDRWKLAFGYAFLQPDLQLDASSRESAPLLFNSPRQQFHVRSHLDLPGSLELDALLFLVDRLIGTNIPGYTRLDVRLGWRPHNNVEASIVVQNLLNHRHQQIDALLTEQPSRLGRSIYGKLTWRF